MVEEQMHNKLIHHLSAHKHLVEIAPAEDIDELKLVAVESVVEFVIVEQSVAAVAAVVVVVVVVEFAADESAVVIPANLAFQTYVEAMVADLMVLVIVEKILVLF